jgi:dienelactone hydrolase
LKKRQEERTQTVTALREELEFLRRCSKSPLRLLCRPRILLPAGLAVLVIVSLSVLGLIHRERSRWADEEAVPEIERLIEEERFIAAFDLARQAADYAGGDAIPEELWGRMSRPVSITTEPAGAELLWKEYGDVGGEWRSLGTAPVDGARLPLGFLRWQARKESHVPMELASPAGDGTLSFLLLPEDHPEQGMVRVPESTVDLELVAGLRTSPIVELNEFLIDRYEVTNGEFMEFVEAGGYDRPELWKHPFQDGGSELPFDEAMSRFRDSTGMRGPTTWEFGSYPEGTADYPVTGVSWYEAAAYAAYAGKELPTIYHWHAAAETDDTASHLLPLANFASSGPREVGLSHVLGSFGTYDMAGNVKEWCHNATGSHRFILGGSWNDPSYMYWLTEDRPAFNRSPESGFRCMKQLGGGSMPEQALAAISLPALRDYSTEEPAADDFFRVYLKFFDYDRVPLEAVTEFVDDSSRFWTREAISFSAGYGDERITAYLFLPKSSKPPYQTIILFPGAGAFSRTTSLTVDDLHSWYAVDFIIKSGRAVLYPVWKGTHERRDGFRIRASTASFREHAIQWSKEFRQTVDLLESRADVDSSRIGYCGSSFGSVYGPFLMALEERIRVGVLWLGGLPTQELPPEIDPLNYVPRVTVPVLMINGRYDNLFPLEMSQLPLYRFLGAAEEDKRHVLFDVGHSIPRPRQEAIREVLDWLDRYLGPVD